MLRDLVISDLLSGVINSTLMLILSPNYYLRPALNPQEAVLHDPLLSKTIKTIERYYSLRLFLVLFSQSFFLIMTSGAAVYLVYTL